MTDGLVAKATATNLETDNPPGSDAADRFAALDRAQVIAEFLARWMLVVTPESAGRTVTPRAPSDFELVVHSTCDAASCYLPANMVHQTEPRIPAVGRALQALARMNYWQTENGLKTSPDGFRLRHLASWCTEIRPGDMEPIEHYLAAGVCNVACEFCYEFGTPAAMRTPKQRVSLSEMNTRMKFYDPEAGRALFDIFHQYYDAFSHPDCMTFLKMARQKSDAILDLITNGRTLTQDVVDQLTELMPVHLTISLNSADPARRKIVMRDKTPEVAARSLPMLAEAGIPFGIVIVPWPPLIDEDDMEATIRFVDQFNPNFVSVSLPGYSKYLPNSPSELTEDFHTRIIERVRKLRKTTSVPLLVQPRLAEAERFGEQHERPFVLGTFPDTPARNAGFVYGDLVTAINGLKVNWAYDATRLLELMQINEQRKVVISAERKGELFTHTLRLSEKWAHSGRGFGLIVGQGIGARTLQPVISSLRAGEQVWALTSRWMKASIERMLLSMAEDPSELEELSLKIVPNRYFGGNIELGDLLVLSDFEYFISEAAKTTGLPDRIFIPLSPFSSWRRDMVGEDADRLKRLFGDRIRFLNNACITV